MKTSALFRVAGSLLVAALPFAAFGMDTMGKLFFTPAQRAELDRLRGKAAEVITLDGVVKRAGGKSTVWINGVAQTENTAAQEVTLIGKPRDAGAVLQISSGRKIRLKAGQAYDITSDKVQEGFALPQDKPADNSEH